MSLHPTGLLKWVTLGDMSQEHGTGTGRSNNSLRVTCPLWQKILVAAIELCLHDRLHKFKLVWIRAPGRRDKMKQIFKVASCDLSPQENKNQSVPTYTHQNLGFPAEKLFVCTKQASCLSDLSPKQYTGDGLSQRPVPATSRLVCPDPTFKRALVLSLFSGSHRI